MTLRLYLWKHTGKDGNLLNRQHAWVAYAWASTSTEPCPRVNTVQVAHYYGLCVDISRVADIGPLYEKLREIDTALPAQPTLVYCFPFDATGDTTSFAQKIGRAAGRCGFPTMPEFAFLGVEIHVIVPTPEDAAKFALFWDDEG